MNRSSASAIKKVGFHSSSPIERPDDGLFVSLFRRIPLGRLERFCHRTGLGIRSGVDVIKIFQTEARNGQSSYGRSMLAVVDQLEKGETLAEAMRSLKGFFPPLLLQMVAAGEQAGKLEQVFENMGIHYGELRQARTEFWGRMTWPLIQLAMALGIVSFVIWIQGFTARGPEEYQFDALGLGLKGTKGLALFWTYAGLVLAGIIALVVLVWKNVGNCHRWIVPWIRPIPVLGSLFTNLALSRISMTLSMLLNAGVDALRTVREAFLSTGNDYYIQKMPLAVEHVQQGESLAASFESTGIFPVEFIEGIEVGELSGNETESLEFLAKEYNRRAKASLAQLSTIASTSVWILIAGMIIMVIFRMAFQYINMINSLLP